MGRHDDKLSRDWSAVFRAPQDDPSDGELPTVIDASVSEEMAAAVAAARGHDSGPPRSLEAGEDTVAERLVLDSTDAGFPVVDPTEEVAVAAAELRTTAIAPPRRASAISVRPLVRSAPAPRDATHIDIASALGVAPAPPPVAPPAPLEPSARPTTGALEPLLSPEAIPPVFEELNAPDRRSGGASYGALDPDELRRFADTTESVSRLLPVILVLFLMIASGLVAVLLLSGGPTTQEHVELKFLTTRGRPGAVAHADDISRIAVVTDPAGLLVLHGRDILGKTPLNLDLPVTLRGKVGVELAGPYFERWVGEVTPDDSGTYRVQVRLKRRR